MKWDKDICIVLGSIMTALLQLIEFQLSYRKFLKNKIE